MPEHTDFADVYAASSWTYVTKSLEEALTRIAQAGFRWVELWGDQAHVDPRVHPDVKSIRDLVRKLGLRVHSIHAPFSGLNIGLPDPAPKATWLDVVGASLEICADVGGTIAVVHVSSHQHDLRTEEAYSASKKIICEFVDALKLRGQRLCVKLALENVLAVGGQRQVGYSLQELATVFPDHDVGFCLDVGHSAIAGFDINAEIQASRGRLLTTHISNNDAMVDHHWIPSKGKINWPTVKNAFAANGYKALHVLEVDGRNTPDDLIYQIAEFAHLDVQDRDMAQQG